ncbi:MAG TPA: thioredoxin family protein [Verrucomicrobiae bacterium]|nr:thioredoxin family protein [Verrucomicrobiae bacterium]
MTNNFHCESVLALMQGTAETRISQIPGPRDVPGSQLVRTASPLAFTMAIPVSAPVRLLFALMICFSSFSARAEDGLAWGSDLTNALQVAKTSKRPVLIQFTAPWCPYCRQMESKTFKDPAVAGSLEQFERVAVNIDQNAALAAQHAVHGIPAFVMLDPEGDEAAKTTGFMEAEPFNKWLTESMTNLTVSTAQKEEFQSQSRELEAALTSADSAARVKGLDMALDWCDRREKLYRSFGREKLEALAKAEPQLLLDGLKHPGLMARIRVANLLREKLGEEFNIDPWEKAGVRETAVQAWKAKLAAKADAGSKSNKR